MFSRYGLLGKFFSYWVHIANVADTLVFLLINRFLGTCLVNVFLSFVRYLLDVGFCLGLLIGGKIGVIRNLSFFGSLFIRYGLLREFFSDWVDAVDIIQPPSQGIIHLNKAVGIVNLAFCISCIGINFTSSTILLYRRKVSILTKTSIFTLSRLLYVILSILFCFIICSTMPLIDKESPVPRVSSQTYSIVKFFDIVIPSSLESYFVTIVTISQREII